MNLDTYFESESLMNIYDEIQVKEESVSMIECIAMTLGKNVEMVEWVLHNDPVKLL